MQKRFGLTMRVDATSGSSEKRDCLAQDWSAFFAAALPEALGIPIPNIGPEAVRYAQELKLDGVILTGGNDVGSCPARDATETTLLTYASQQSLPVLGICRGLHMIQTHCGGLVRSSHRARHVATRHTIFWEESAPYAEQWRGIKRVNSFHAQAVLRQELAPALQTLAFSEDGLVEALRHRHLPIVAMQWHPERDLDAPLQDRAFVRHALGLTQ